MFLKIYLITFYFCLIFDVNEDYWFFEFLIPIYNFYILYKLLK